MTKGKTNNPHGRPAGSPNKVTSTIRTWLVSVINDNREQLETDLQNLEPKERLQMIEKLLPYILPKVERADEVEGACFSKDDVETTSFLDVKHSKGEIKKWFDN